MDAPGNRRPTTPSGVTSGRIRRVSSNDDETVSRLVRLALQEDRELQPEDRAALTELSRWFAGEYLGPAEELEQISRPGHFSATPPEDLPPKEFPREELTRLAPDRIGVFAKETHAEQAADRRLARLARALRVDGGVLDAAMENCSTMKDLAKRLRMPYSTFLDRLRPLRRL